ncbi:hypothetical protein C2G38_2180523 [Gigaspora rosea]|uniref:Uncharacterized protein n=1 Tax=Gigaspora rosea TaxID=44941 RepID=A0A397VL81_9GLOM|nr:hypothetical protein C2G38_2180523 [Gigaspora rosea]
MLMKRFETFRYPPPLLSDQNAPPQIVDIKTNDDGTILVHIIRYESTKSVDCSKIGGTSLEQKLRIRFIFLNGTVKEIDPNLNLDPINYCLLNNDKYEINKLNNIVIYLNDTKNNNISILHNLVNPITIYPLQKPYILITYVKTNDPSNLTTYEECMEFIDWDGNSRSEPSNACAWNLWINSTIQLNVNKKLGFIRFAHKHGWCWMQYSIITDTFTDYSLITIVSTVDNNYLVIFNYTQEININTLLIPRYGLCAILISNNQTTDNYPYPGQTIDIYPIAQHNVIINSINCDKSDVLIV